MIGIVIPYYQKLPGLLNRALRSVAAQEGQHQLRVYVVDDGSPIPAEAGDKPHRAGELISCNTQKYGHLLVSRTFNQIKKASEACPYKKRAT